MGSLFTHLPLLSLAACPWVRPQNGRSFQGTDSPIARWWGWKPWLKTMTANPLPPSGHQSAGNQRENEKKKNKRDRGRWRKRCFEWRTSIGLSWLWVWKKDKRRRKEGKKECVLMVTYNYKLNYSWKLKLKWKVLMRWFPLSTRKYF